MPEDPNRTDSPQATRKTATLRHPRSLAATARGPDRLLGLFFLAVSALLVAGWTLPTPGSHPGNRGSNPLRGISFGC